MAVASDGSVLAHWLPQVHVLPSGIGGNRPVLLHQKRHDSLQDRLQTVSLAVLRLPRLVLDRTDIRRKD